MKVGDLVRWCGSDRTGVSLGIINKYSVEWVLVRWSDGAETLTSKEILEVVDEGG